MMDVTPTPPPELAAPPDPALVAARLAGQLDPTYALAGPLGAGGMGLVFRGRDVRLQRDVAIKVLHSHFAAEPTFRERFIREARALALCSHPNVLPVYYCANPDAELLYLVTELVDGASLAAWLAHRGPLPWEVALALVERCLSGLAAAHAQGVLHRDIKPANILLSVAGAPKLADFGVARVLGSATLTTGEAVVGTLRYLAPEALDDPPSSPAQDVYAMGCVLFECLSGVAAFPQHGMGALVSAIAAGRYPRLESICPHVWPEVVPIVEAALATAVDERYPTAESMRTACAEVLDAVGCRDPAALCAVFFTAPDRVGWLTATRGAMREHLLARARSLSLAGAGVEAVELATRLPLLDAVPAAVPPARALQSARATPSHAAPSATLAGPRFGEPGAATLARADRASAGEAPGPHHADAHAAAGDGPGGGPVGIAASGRVRGLLAAGAVALLPALQALVAQARAGAALAGLPHGAPAAGAAGGAGAGLAGAGGAAIGLADPGLVAAAFGSGGTVRVASWCMLAPVAALAMAGLALAVFARRGLHTVAAGAWLGALATLALAPGDAAAAFGEADGAGRGAMLGALAGIGALGAALTALELGPYPARRRAATYLAALLVPAAAAGLATHAATRLRVERLEQALALDVPVPAPRVAVGCGWRWPAPPSADGGDVASLGALLAQGARPEANWVAVELELEAGAAALEPRIVTLLAAQATRLVLMPTFRKRDGGAPELAPCQKALLELVERVPAAWVMLPEELSIYFSGEGDEVPPATRLGRVAAALHARRPGLRCGVADDMPPDEETPAQGLEDVASWATCPGVEAVMLPAPRGRLSARNFDRLAALLRGRHQLDRLWMVSASEARAPRAAWHEGADAAQVTCLGRYARSRGVTTWLHFPGGSAAGPLETLWPFSR